MKLSRDEVKLLLDQFKPHCGICSCYSGDSRNILPTEPATRIAYIPREGMPTEYGPYPYYLCDECDFSDLDGYDRYEWEQNIGQKLPDPSEFEDAPWAATIRKCKEYVKNLRV